ncbi:hypothetical protein EMCRGX_G004314 [Ephydatia muelleri]|eukprot:Em0007g295a
MASRSYEEILREPFVYICQVKGKEVRVKLIEAFNLWMKIPEEKRVEVQLITQMLHNASLMIDDIEDNSKLRRGIPVTHNIFGTPLTINSGNYMYFVALEKTLALGHPKAVHIYTHQLLELHRGQGKDIYWRDSVVCPTEEEYIVMVRQKTGGLFMLAVELMQLFSESKMDFAPLTDALGLFFQIRDDYANLSSKEYMDNKSFCEDLTEGKFSFLIIHGIRADRSSKLLNILRQRTTDLDIKKYFLQCLEETGSFEYTRKVLLDLEQRCLSEIQKLGGNQPLEELILKLSHVYREEPCLVTGSSLTSQPPH